MTARICTILGIVAAFLVCDGGGCNIAQAQTNQPPAKKPKEPEELTLSALSMEVAALRTLHRFQVTPTQVEALANMAGETAMKVGKGLPIRASDKVRKRLLDLRDALVDSDDERAQELEEKLAALLEEEKVDLEDRVKVTPTAMRKAQEFMKALRPGQIVSFLSDSVDDLPEPINALVDVLDVVADLKDKEWRELSDDIITDMKWQLGGIDAERTKAIGDKVADYLKKVRALKGKEIEDQRTELEKAAEQIVSQTPPILILQNFVEHSVAELLSNPRLAGALDARRENEPKLKDPEKKTPDVKEPEKKGPEKKPSPKKDSDKSDK